jgi:uncharacterized protein YlxW (UPF0749 family)
MDIHGGAMREQQAQTTQQLEQAQREIVQLRDQLRQVQAALLTLARERAPA